MHGTLYSAQIHGTLFIVHCTDTRYTVLTSTVEIHGTLYEKGRAQCRKLEESNL